MLSASVSLSALPPLVALSIAVGFTVYCLVDLGRAPLGGILYLLPGRTRDRGVRQ